MALVDQQALQHLREEHEKGILLGLKGVSGTVERLDIDVLLSKSPKTFNLFLLALDKLQNDVPYGKRMSFFQLAGIHGLPRALWDGVGHKQGGGIERGGYCAHGSEQFPTWHRPYLALMEQTLYLEMMKIAESYHDAYRNDYIQAVQGFRLPYWDFHRPRGHAVSFPGVLNPNKTTNFDYDYSVPRIFSVTDVTVRKPPHNQLQALGNNPLNFFKFPDGGIPSDEWQQLSVALAEAPIWDDKLQKRRQPTDEEKVQRSNEIIWKIPRDHTIRYPMKSGPGQDTERLNKVMNELRMDTNRLVLTMVKDPGYDRYINFATSGTFVKTPAGPKPSGSLEALHNNYHVMLGGFPNPGELVGGGHMSRVPLSAFDPIFWIYHCQIDRIFAVWQASHPDKPEAWFSNLKLAEDGLMPFRKRAGIEDKDCWTSNQWKRCDALGATYPDLLVEGISVLDHFRKMYEWSVPLTSADQIGKPPPEMEPLDLSQAEVFSSVPKPNSQFSLLSTMQAMTLPELKAEMKAVPNVVDSDDGFSYEWYIDDQVQRLALNGAFTIFYFVMDEPQSLRPDADYVMEPSLAGITHVFAAPEQICDNCGLQGEQSAIVTNTVPVTSLLLDYLAKGTLESLRPEHVKPFLIKGLKWRVVSVNAELQDSRFMANSKHYKVSVSCKKARLPRNSDEVEYQDYPEIIETIISHASATPTA